jgi:hypothetical protein
MSEPDFSHSKKPINPKIGAPPPPTPSPDLPPGHPPDTPPVKTHLTKNRPKKS